MTKLKVRLLGDIEGYGNKDEIVETIELPTLHVANANHPTGFYVHVDEYELVSEPSPGKHQAANDSVSTLRLLAKCGSMDLSMLGPIADEMEQMKRDAAWQSKEIDAFAESLSKERAEIERLQKWLQFIEFSSEDHGMAMQAAHDALYGRAPPEGRTQSLETHARNAHAMGRTHEPLESTTRWPGWSEGKPSPEQPQGMIVTGVPEARYVHECPHFMGYTSVANYQCPKCSQSRS